jgi:DNA-binding response OmpR family regulator
MAPGILRFADFELDRNVYELRRNAHPLKLERIPLDLLFLLIEKRGQLVTREEILEILERLWGKGVFFDVDTLSARRQNSGGRWATTLRCLDLCSRYQQRDTGL